MAVFADTWFYLALFDERDSNHERVATFAEANELEIVTTRWVLAEVANAFCKPSTRPHVVLLLELLDRDSATRVIANSDELFDKDRLLYERRPDKEWSLTDCISFVVMGQEGLHEALTNDHHFTQAGYVAAFAGRA